MGEIEIGEFPSEFEVEFRVDWRGGGGGFLPSGLLALVPAPGLMVSLIEIGEAVTGEAVIGVGSDTQSDSEVSENGFERVGFGIVFGGCFRVAFTGVPKTNENISNRPTK